MTPPSPPHSPSPQTTSLTIGATAPHNARPSDATATVYIAAALRLATRDKPNSTKRMEKGPSQKGIPSISLLPLGDGGGRLHTGNDGNGLGATGGGQQGIQPKPHAAGRETHDTREKVPSLLLPPTSTSEEVTGLLPLGDGGGRHHNDDDDGDGETSFLTRDHPSPVRIG